MQFEKFTGEYRGFNPGPLRMAVGQVVVRTPSHARLYQLRAEMRKAMKEGMEFSVAREGDTFAIRRDK